MVILRVDCKSGLHVEFAYNDLESANDYAERLMGDDAARVVLITDVHGRAAWIKPSEVIHAMVVDLSIEQAEMAKQSLEIQRIQQESALAWKRQAESQPRVVQARASVLGPNGQVINALGGVPGRR